MVFTALTALALAITGAALPADTPATPRTITTITTTSAPGTPARPAKPAAPLSPAAPQAPASPTLVSDPVTGRFTTAFEVKPILTATKNVWVAVREYEGRDLIYVTQIWSWRCGLTGLSLSINGGAPEIWDLPPCHDDTATPNAILEEDGLPFRAYPLGAVQQITVTLTYDDLTTDSATYTRPQVLMP